VRTGGGLVVMVALAAACGNRRPETRPQSLDRDYVYQDELRHTQSPDLYTALRQLRPNWFSRSPAVLRGQGDIFIYVDGVYWGGTASLRQLPVQGAVVVHYYSPGEAQSTFGAGPLYGAIAVTTGPR
jgi:hypothetical protein